MNTLAAKPNAAHRTLAKWEADGWLSAVVTQNVDGLHQAAGSRKVYELHGSTWRNYCLRCHAAYGPEAVFQAKELVPRCSCGGMLRPDVVLYEEDLENATLHGAIRAIEKADVLLVAGTSLTVYPAAGLLQYFQGDALVLINRDETPWDSLANLCIHDSVGVVLGEVADLPKCV